MDFAALMSREIAKAKPTSATNPAQSSDQSSKYLKRAEIEVQRQENYRAEQAALLAEKEAKARNKRKFEEEQAQRNRERDEKRQKLAEESKKRREEEAELEDRARRKRLGLPEPPSKEDETQKLADGEEDIEEDELVRKLREKGEPIKLFGENHRQMLRRYRKLTQKVMVGFTTLELVEERDMLVAPVAPPASDVAGRAYLFRQLASYFSMVLNEWERALNRRTEEVRASSQGKKAYNAMVLAKEDLKPLFRKFEKADVGDVLDAIVEIVRAAQEKRYVDANDGYLRLSIGKASVSPRLPHLRKRLTEF